jgi:hypothetical protein
VATARKGIRKMGNYATNAFTLWRILDRVGHLAESEIERTIEAEAQLSEQFCKRWYHRFLDLVYDPRICELLNVNYAGLGHDSSKSKQDLARLKLVAMLYVKEAEDTPLPLL